MKGYTKNTKPIYDTGKIILSEDYKKHMIQNNNTDIDIIIKYIDLFEDNDPIIFGKK